MNFMYFAMDDSGRRIRKNVRDMIIMKISRTHSKITLKLRHAPYPDDDAYEHYEQKRAEKHD